MIESAPFTAPDPQRVADRLAADREGRIRAVLVCQVDTASSVRADIPAIRAAMGDHPAALAVDAIASLGCEEMRMDDWGIDVLVSASQKGLMVPPGLGFVWYSEKVAAGRGAATPYWDWRPRSGAQELWRHWGGTPPVQHIYGLAEALAMLLDEEEATTLAIALRAASATVAGIGLGLVVATSLGAFTAGSHLAFAVTAVLLGLTNEVVLVAVVLHPARPAAVRVSAPAVRNWRRFRVECMGDVLLCRW